MPLREIQLGNKVEDSRLFNSFQRRHSRFPLIRRKTIGIGLIDLSLFSNGKDYISSVNGKNSAAYFSRKSQRAGFQFKLINPNNFIDSIQKIHFSAKTRQGKEIEASYLNKIEKYPIDDRNSYFGIFRGDLLVAYLWAIKSSELIMINRIMGHSDFLKDGIMYQLLTEFITHTIDKEKTETKFVMYDTMLGASDGLRLFKERCGFRPYRVNWRISSK